MTSVLSISSALMRACAPVIFTVAPCSLRLVLLERSRGRAGETGPKNETTSRLGGWATQAARGRVRAYVSTTRMREAVQTRITLAIVPRRWVESKRPAIRTVARSARNRTVPPDEHAGDAAREHQTAGGAPVPLRPRRRGRDARRRGGDVGAPSCRRRARAPPAVYVPIAPCRLADTRAFPDTVGGRSLPMTSGRDRHVPGAGARTATARSRPRPRASPPTSLRSIRVRRRTSPSTPLTRAAPTGQQPQLDRHQPADTEPGDRRPLGDGCDQRRSTTTASSTSSSTSSATTRPLRPGGGATGPQGPQGVQGPTGPTGGRATRADDPDHDRRRLATLRWDQDRGRPGTILVGSAPTAAAFDGRTCGSSTTAGHPSARSTRGRTRSSRP